MKKVLVIEDNKDNIRLVRYALERAGYQVLPAETGEAGVALALDEDLVFIVMDINLPGIDGVEATRRIRSMPQGATIPIVAITSFAMSGDRERILEAGCTAYFEKPIDPLTLVERIHQAIGIG
ncbi:response regulator [Geomesophilobacter sediminis]|uniref:Response regulator n=1 Tax=Geomesophilobacter sediminis TaxID=2798584 RepID=A0A8J7M335_9BACT|nr:response regulator [Geomesophilobacter sediminis]MBJ6727778.1 response regulator [Geomesophilobacter sediminis]